MSHREDYHFSITVKIDDKPTLYCLRALAMYAQQRGNNRIPWRGTTDKKWRNNQNQVTFFFTQEDYRASFISEASRLISKELWEIVSERDDLSQNQ